MRSQDGLPVIFFDGYCNLCSGLIRFVLKRGGRKKFRFVPLQEIGETASYGVIGDLEPGTVAVYDRGQVYYRSDAVLRICAILGFPWNLARTGMVIPRLFRDKLYNFVASNRIRWFGERTTCYRPENDDR
jgi:predicted DCC family thiol-disulfide oxidoreductase YuxK